MSRLFLLLFKFRNPIIQEAIRRNLRMRFHRYALVDFFLNLVAPLKVYARPECITGISRFKLHFLFRGRIYVAPENKIVFENASWATETNGNPLDIDLRGKDNSLTVKGILKSLPSCLVMRGLSNKVEIGSSFDCTENNLEWVLTGTRNSIVYGDNVKVFHNSIFGETGEFIRMTGEGCRVKVGDSSRVRLLVEAEPGSSRDFDMEIGSHSGIASLYVDMASSTRVRIGEGFFCSWDSYLWCGAHALLDAEGDVLNECKQIEIGKNVWFGHGVEVPGEIKVADGCIIGSGVTLVSNVTKPGSIVAVAPAKIYPANVRWVRESPVQYKSGLRWKM